MKCLNLGRSSLDYVDDIIWENNPYYCHPQYCTFKSNVTFKNLCENALSFLADVCLQGYLCGSTSFENELDRLDENYFRENSDLLSESGSDIDNESCGATVKFYFMTKLEEFLFEKGFKASPVNLKESNLTHDSECLYKADYLIWRTDGQLFKVFRDDSDKNSVLNDIDCEITSLQLEIENVILSFNSLQISNDSFKQEFLTLFELFDQIQNYDFLDLDNVSFETVLKLCDGLKINMEENTRLGLLLPLNKSKDELTKQLSSMDNHDIKIVENTNQTSRKENKKVLSFSQQSFASSFVTNLYDDNSLKDEGNYEFSCSSGACDVPDWTEESEEGLDLMIGDLEDVVSAMLDESEEMSLRYKGEIAQVTRKRDVVLPVVWEEEEEDEGVWSDVESWKRDLRLTVLEDSEDDWFQATSVSLPTIINQWFSSTDGEGRVYFFEENSNKSSWALPDTENTTNNENKNIVDLEEISSLSNLPVIEKCFNRYVKSKSMILGRYEESIPLSNNWPQLWEGTMCILKEGPLNKTKITENGKRLRKNWTSTHAVLTELLLLFFKDNKGFPSMMNGKGRPELSVDLNGAVVDTGDKVSSRKHVYMLSTVLGLQVLIQFDSALAAEQWLDAIQATIFNLPSSFGAKGIRAKSDSPSQDDKLNSRISRSKSLKLKSSASIEDLSNIAERQVKIRERLKKFFHRRPTVDQLVKKGIWKDEPVFGCLLEQACPTEAPRVPQFVIHCIRCIERTEENMKADGLYRASGNLSQVQKIRLQVDQNIYSLLEEEEDVHVLAGTLKLFFRELKQPLIPFRFFNKALSGSTNPHRAEKIRDFRDIVKALPPCNHDTLKILLQHLLSVTRFHEYNRMHIPNIAIVFGPTLMWPEQESTNMAFDMMQQNLVIECFLSDFHAIFH